MLSRDQFELACHIFAARHSHWSWVSGGRPGYGYLTRTRYHRWKTPFDSFSYVDSINLEEVEVEEDDQATAQLSEPPSLIVHEIQVRVQVLSGSKKSGNLSDGSSLSLQEIMQTSLLKVKLPNGSEASNYSLMLPTQSFPVISHGEHPTTGLPCWYFHPCESERAVNEFMQEGEGEERSLGRWLEIWLMIVGNILNV